MKLFQSAMVLSLSAVIGLSAYAETNTSSHKPKQPVKKVQADHNAKKAKNVKKTTPVDTEAQQLKRFSESLELKFVGVSTKQVNNEPILDFNYEVKNISKNTMNQVHWATLVSFNQQTILVLDYPIKFSDGLKPNVALPMTYSLPFSQLSPLAQQVFSDPKNQVSIQFQAKGIDFKNGKKIIVN